MRRQLRSCNDSQCPNLRGQRNAKRIAAREFELLRDHQPEEGCCGRLEPGSRPRADHVSSVRTHLSAWKAGYSPSGILAGRLALPLEDATGIVGYFGRALAEDQQPLKFPNEYDPRSFVFGAFRAEGEVRIVRDVLDVLGAYQAGETAICFLTELIEPSQMELLAVLQHERKFTVFL